jgi:hypothetical protein
VVHPERRDAEDADRELVAGLDDVQRSRVEELVLLELSLDQALGQPRGVDRGSRDLGKDVRQRPGVVLVAVGQDDAAHAISALGQVRDVGDDEVDPEHVGLGEREPAVDDEDLTVDFDGGDVLADLAHPAERNDAQGFGH